MITLRCTKRAARSLAVAPIPDASAGTSSLGDWYANLIPTVGGDFYIFVNERSLLTVTVPASEPSTLQLFVRRVANLLALIGVPDASIERELEHFQTVQIGKTQHRAVLGSMNDIAFHVQDALEEGTRSRPVSLSSLECRLAEIPFQALKYRFPREIAVDLIACGPGAV